MKTTIYFATTKKAIGHAGGFYKPIPAGSRVEVMPAFNQPGYKTKQLVFIASDIQDTGPAMLISLRDGVI